MECGRVVVAGGDGVDVCVSEEVRVLLDGLAGGAMVLDRDFGLTLGGRVLVERPRIDGGHDENAQEQ